MNEEIIKIVRRLKKWGQLERRGVLPRQVVQYLPPEYTYSTVYVQRIMKRMAEQGHLQQVGLRSGYLVP